MKQKKQKLLTIDDWAKCLVRQFNEAIDTLDAALRQTDLVQARNYMIHAQAFLENAAACVKEIAEGERGKAGED